MSCKSAIFLSPIGGQSFFCVFSGPFSPIAPARYLFTLPQITDSDGDWIGAFAYTQPHRPALSITAVRLTDNGEPATYPPG